jgi:hypothetical protein
MGCRVLLITHYLIRKILMETVLDVHIKCVKIKKFIDPDVVKIHFLQEKKKVYKEIPVLVYTQRIICFS